MFDQIRPDNDLLHQALTGLNARQRAINHNLANADTPGYQALEVSFEDQMQARRRELKGQADAGFKAQGAYTNPEHMSLDLPQDQAFTLSEKAGVMRNDNNGVDLEQEVAKMSQAQVAYQAVSQMIGGRFSQLKYVIAEGGR